MEMVKGKKMTNLPAFVLCIDNADNQICEVGRVYSTLEPVGKYASKTFWEKTLNLFKHEFEIVGIEAYLNQVDAPDTSFDGIELHGEESSFHQQTVKEKKKPVKKSPAKQVKKVVVKKEPILMNFPEYVKYVSEYCNLGTWIGDLEIEVGKTYRLSDFPDKQKQWGRALSLHKECFEVSNEANWKLSQPPANWKEHAENKRKRFVERFGA